MDSEGGMAGLIGLEHIQQHSWQQNWLDEDDDQDSDTDSKLSGSAAADSVMRQLARARFPHKGGGAEFGLDTMREQDEEDAGGEELIATPPEVLSQQSYKGSSVSAGGHRGVGPGGGGAHGLTNGYQHHTHRHQGNPSHHHAHPSHVSHHTPSMATPSTASTRSPQMSRRHPAASPQFHHRPRVNYENGPRMNYENGPRMNFENGPRMNFENGPRMSYENVQSGGSYARKDMLGSLPEGGPRVLEISVPTALHGPPARGRGIAGSYGAGTQSMENVMTRGTPPSSRRNTLEQLPNGRPHYKEVRLPMASNGLANSYSHEVLPHMAGGSVAYPMDHAHDESFSEINVGSYHHQQLQAQPTYRRTSSGSHAGNQNSSHLHSHSAAGVLTPNHMNHYRSSSMGSGTRAGMPLSALAPSHSQSSDLGQSWPLATSTRAGGGDSQRTPPQRRVNYVRQEIKPQHSLGISQSTVSGSSGDVTEPDLDDVVQFLHSEDYIVVSNAASYIQHLAYNDDNMKNKIREKDVIPILVNLVRHSETKVQITALGALKNLSFGRTMNENKQLIGTDHGLTEIMGVLKKSRVSEVRELLTGLLWNLSSCEDLKMRMIQGCLHDLVEIVMAPHTKWNTEVARSPTARPQQIYWNSELKNTTGTLRNMSSAGESARSFMRSTTGMVDTLLWLLKAGVQQRSVADEKTVENTVCILRNLSYRLESEVDPQEAGEDILDREWEMEQRRDAEVTPHNFSRKSPGCLAMCVKSRTRDDVPRVSSSSVNTPVFDVDFVNPESSAIPKRRKPVYGKCLLWLPEVAFVYLAVVELYPDSIETLESAAGAIQNLTACRWKWSIYIRNIIRTSNGLRLLADLLSNSHDTVVRAAALTLRNLMEDHRNRAAMGGQVVANILPRLPLGSNHLGISEETSVALLCCLMELFNDNQDNADSFRDKNGLNLLTRLARSREHTLKVTFAAHKTCSILWDYKDCKSSLKKLGWDISHYHHLASDEETQLELEPQGSMARGDFQGSSRRKQHHHHRGGSNKRSSKKSSKKKDRDREREEAGVGFIAGGLPRAPEVADCQVQSSTSVATMSSPVRPGNNPPHVAEIQEEPNYQVIPAPPSSARPSNHNRQQQDQQQQVLSPSGTGSPIPPNYESLTTSPAATTTSSGPTQSGPTIIYQSIDESPIRSSAQSSGRVDTAMSATMSATNVSSTNSGPLSVTSEEPEPDPNATYALVDIEKKRASRRAKEQKKKEDEEEKERQKKQQEEAQTSEEPIDSWV